MTTPTGHPSAARSMRVLCVGDVVGEEAASWLAGRLGQLRDEHELDWVVVNAENCAVTGPNPMDGFGMTVEVVDDLIEAGVDVITGGNHSWDGPDVDTILANPQVVRPLNLDEERGRGLLTISHGDTTLTMINLLSPTAELPGMAAPKPRPLWQSWQEITAEHDLPGSTVIDLHGESPWEKASFAAALDGRASAVVGTHTHDPTQRGHVLPGGTGYVTELGMTGRLGHTGGGFDPMHFVAKMRGEDYTALPANTLAKGPLALGAVVLDIDPAGATTAITRIA